MKSLSEDIRRRDQLRALEEELNAWAGAEVRVWHFSCSHNRFALRLARGIEGKREFKFLKFAMCDSISLRNLNRLSQVRIADIGENRWRFDSDGISIVFWNCSFTEATMESLQEMAGIAPPILLERK